MKCMDEDAFRTEVGDSETEIGHDDSSLTCYSFFFLHFFLQYNMNIETRIAWICKFDQYLERCCSGTFLNACGYFCSFGITIREKCIVQFSIAQYHRRNEDKLSGSMPDVLLIEQRCLTTFSTVKIIMSAQIRFWHLGMKFAGSSPPIAGQIPHMEAIWCILLFYQ